MFCLLKNSSNLEYTNVIAINTYSIDIDNLDILLVI